jgi:di/tricarboxylate transporter
MGDLLLAVMQPGAMATLLVLVASIVLFITGWLAPEITGLLAASSLLFFGVLTPAEAMSGFGSPALMTLGGLFVLSAGLFQSGGLDGLRTLIGSDAIRTPQKMIFLMVAVVAPITAVVPNTPIVASLLPVLQGWCRRRRVAPSKILLPLSFVTVLGGTLTLLGSSVNLLASDISEDLGYGSLSLFSFTPIGVAVWLMGGLIMVLMADKTLPDRGADEGDLLTLLSESGYLSEAKVPRGSELIGKTLRNSRLQTLFDVDVLEVHRGGEQFLPPLADFKISQGDRLLLRCGREDLMRLQQEQILAVAHSSSQFKQDDAFDTLAPSQLALLRLVCWIAYADGDFAEEERRFLSGLTSRLLSGSAKKRVAEADDLVLGLSEEAPRDLSVLVADLEDADQKKMLIKLAFQMACSNQRAQDEASFSAVEKQAYSRLVAQLGLPASEVQQAEEEAQQELLRSGSLLEYLAKVIRGVRMWPAKANKASGSSKADDQPQHIVEVLLPHGSTIVGATLKDLNFRQQYNANVLALRRGNEVLHNRLGMVVLREGDLLLLQAPKDSIRGLHANNDLVLMEQLEKNLPPVGRKRTSLLIGLLVILLPAFKITSLLAAVLAGTVAMVVTGCLRAGELQRAIRLDVIVLLGSLASFGVAMEKTGLAEALANALKIELADWPPYAALVAVYFFTVCLTEVMSNAATVAILIPVAGELAEGLSQPPLAFVFAVLFAASQSFLSPVGYQTNLMVFGPGRYRFLDVPRYGFPLTLSMVLFVPLFICRWFHLV